MAKTRRAGQTREDRNAPPGSRRKVTVFFSLVGLLTFTSVLLRALAPAPLVPGAAASLFAVEAPASLDSLFDLSKPLQQGRWQYVYIHQSRTPSGNAQTLGASAGGLGDHFVIGNGDGCVDGELQIGQRWSQQQAAAPAAGLKGIDRDCISICLVGDFNHTRPTATQVRRLAQLVGALQGRLNLAADRVWMLDSTPSAAGIGRYFPQADFRQQLLP